MEGVRGSFHGTLGPSPTPDKDTKSKSVFPVPPQLQNEPGSTRLHLMGAQGTSLCENHPEPAPEGRAADLLAVPGSPPHTPVTIVILANLGCRNDVPQSGWPRRRHHFPQLWRLDIQDTGAAAGVASVNPLPGLQRPDWLSWLWASPGRGNSVFQWKLCFV